MDSRNLQATLPRVEALMAVAGARAVLTEKDYRRGIKAAFVLDRKGAGGSQVARAKWMSVDKYIRKRETAAADSVVSHLMVAARESNRETTCVLQFTSGSTSTPKGALRLIALRCGANEQSLIPRRRPIAAGMEVSGGNILHNLVTSTIYPDVFLSWVTHFHDLGK